MRARPRGATARATTKRDVPVATDPAPAAAPAPPPAPAPVAPDPATAPAARPYVPSGAHVDVTIASIAGGVRRNEVKQAVDHLEPDFTRCYRTALAAKGSPVGGSITIQLRFNETGAATSRVSFAGFLPGLGTCLQGALSRLGRVQGADTGDAEAVVVLNAEPQ
jgi:hypothetical protein